MIDSKRLDSVDVLKGIGIFFVVTNHCFARTTRKFSGVDLTEDPILYFVNRLIHFAVPLFLFVSCALLTKSLMKRYDLASYARNRWRKNVVPYIVASCIYYGIAVGNLNSMRYEDLLHQILTGKAYFHLYFTVVLIQAAIVVPLMVRVLRHRVLDWRWMLCLALGLQVITYEFQRVAIQAERPGSLIIWYWVPLLLGWSVASDSDLKARLRPSIIHLSLSSAALGVGYAFASVQETKHSDLINGLYAIYTGVLAITLWVAADYAPIGHVRTLLAALGEMSLPVFLVHPAVMHFLGGPRLTSWLSKVPFSAVCYWLIVLILSIVVARLIQGTYVGRIVLGESERSVSASTA